jgi:hypothetical protein
MIRRWQVLGVAFTLCGCELVEPAPAGQQYLFDVSYVNFAWGLRWVGLVVEVDGDIVEYERDEAWNPEHPDSFTQAELDARYTSTRVVGHVNQADVLRRLRQLDHVGGEYTSPGFSCADAGTVTYQGYQYDVPAERYASVVVREEGDQARQYTSSAGREIAEWLIHLAAESEIQELTRFQTGGSCIP